MGCILIMRKKALPLLIALVLLLWWVPSALAAPMAGVWYSDGGWFIPCGPGTDGSLKFFLKAEVPVGYIVAVTWDSESVSGDTHHYANKWIETTGLSSGNTEYWVVPHDGAIRLTHTVYSPHGKRLTQAYAYASCVTGDVKVYTRDVY